MDERRVPAALGWLADQQSRHPWQVLTMGLLTLLPALWGIFGHGGLGFRPAFAELLPDNKPSVLELRQVAERLPGLGTLTVVAEIDDGQNRAALQRFVDELVPELEALGPNKVGAVDYGDKDARAFFDEHKLLFARLEDLKRAHEQVLARYDYEVGRAAGFLLDEDEPPPPITKEGLERRLRPDEPKSADAHEGATAQPSGYYLSEDGTMIAVLIRTPVSGKAQKLALLSEVEERVASLEPASFDATMRVAYTGNVITGEEEYDAIVADLMHVGGWGLLGVLLSVLLFFMRIRTLLALGVTIGVSLLWTFGLTRLTIGYLNSSTGFLVSIIAGNGINYGIMYMARYIEARRDEQRDVATSIRLAHRDSWVPTLAGSTTAMLAYGSLLLTDFRGFKHFGIISGYGMILCWLATYALLPAMLVATERILPSFRGRAQGPTRMRGYYGVGFARLARFAPRSVVALGALAGLVSLYAAARYLVDDPMEYNLKNVRNERPESSAAALNSRVDAIVGRLGQDGMAIMTERLDQVPLLEAELRKRWDAARADQKPFDRVVTIFSLLPAEQADKIPLIEEMRDRIERARKLGFIDDDTWQSIQPHLPQGVIAPLRIDDLPEQVARPFTERDGTRGRIVYIAPSTGWSVWNARYLMRWADSYRLTRLPTGELIRGSGSAVIYADMIETIAEDTPKAIAFSALGSILVILVAFRFRRLAWGVFIPWLAGIGGLFAYLYFSGTQLNFLNFVAIPITIGIGAEYAHNMMQRYRIEGPRRVYHVTVETGGAVILCSLTTTIGYLALTLSINQGICSFGRAAAVGEIACVLAAVLMLPAALSWWTRRSSDAQAGARRQT